MNYKNIKYIAGKFSESSNRSRFMNFARMVALGSVTLGSMALIISLSVLNGFEIKLREKAIEFSSHLSIASMNESQMAEGSATADTLKKYFPQIERIVPVIKREGLIRSSNFIDGVLLRGITSETDITNMRKNIIEGKFDFSDALAKEIIIGKSMARKLNVSLGDTVVLFVIKDPQRQSELFPEVEKMRVSAIYETGMSKYDDLVAYIPYARAAKLFSMPATSANSFDVILKDIDQAFEVSNAIDNFLGFPYYSYTVFESHSSIFAWIELQKAPIPLVLGLISIVAVLNIITILLITVVEKTHSIGILRALGLDNKSIISIFVYQGTLIGLIGTLSGCTLGLILGFLQKTFKIISLKGDIYILDSLPVEFDIWHFVIVISISVILSFLATLIPSFAAVKVQPLRAIRFK